MTCFLIRIAYLLFYGLTIQIFCRHYMRARLCFRIRSIRKCNLYRELTKSNPGCKAIGKGEAAGIALAKTYNGILASNNYADIAPYIEKYNLRHVDTGHILLEALEKGIINEQDGNVIWQKMLDKNRNLPAGSFTEYMRRVKG